MQNFRTKLIGFAGVAVVFSSMAYGQISCGTMAAAPTPINIRSEGQTELLPSLVLSCTNTIVGSTPAITIQLYTQPGLTFTTPLNAGSTTTTQAIATVAATGTVSPFGPATALVGGVPSPTTSAAGNATNSNALTFNIAAGTAGTGAATFLIELDNVRVNASTLNVAANAAPTILNTVAYTQAGTTVSTTAGAPTLTAFVTNSLTTKIGSDVAYAYLNKIATASNNSATGVTTNNATNTYSVCNSNNNSATAASVVPDFFVTVAETYNNAFRTQAHEVSGIGQDAAVSGVRVKVVLSNVPTGFNIFVPLTVSSSTVVTPAVVGPPAVPATYSAGKLTAQTSETGGRADAAAATSPTQFVNNNSAVPFTGAGFYQVPNSGGTVAIIYEVTTDDNTHIDSYNIPVFIQVGGNVVSATAASVTVQASLAPITAATTVPSFAIGSSSGAPTTLINFAQCQTSLLFPFVTNANGFETGIAIDNATKDPFGSATPQNGLCQLSYYGQGATPVYSTTLAPNPNEGGNAQYLAGEVYAFTLTQALAQPTASSSSPANPATFTGYIIANCKFQDAHGFAYILYGNLGSSTSDTMGYVAQVLNRGSSSPETTWQ
jgi:hypothetical protein